MSNGRFSNNKAIAKIQIILVFAMVLLFGTSCERKELYLRVDTTEISVEMYDIRLDLLWGIDWETEWQYTWNESAADFGTIGYTKPELIKGTIYNVDRATGKRYSSFFKIFDSNGGRVSLTAGSVYDMLFYNFGTEYTSFYQSDDYETYTASTRVSSQSSWIRTRAESDTSEKPDSSKTYVDYNQPDELFGSLATDLAISEDPSTYEKEYDEYGNVSYIYKVDAALRPYSFIYMYQVVLLNNTNDKGENIFTGAKGFTITGLAQGVDLFTRKTFNNTISVSTDNVKPMQNHDDVRLDDGTIIENADILAGRVITWGLPGIVPIETTKAGTKAVELDKNYIGVGLTLRNGYTYTVTKDITEQMHNKPAGGVITIYIDANDVPEEIINQRPQSTGGGFNASVEDWANEVNAEVTI
ncbi:MAG: DUF5119 domain-containing protein [Bacteroidaceae bacterium]|nr:DUF5119 domain-containing protein [Bacteroidaceae bacterium]